MLQTIRISRSAPWLPAELHRRPGEIRRRIRFSETERKIYRKNKRIPVSRWAEQFRFVTMGVLPGKWRNEVTPYLAGIMDASFYPSVQTVIGCKAPQVGFTEAVLNCIGYAIDRDPGPVLSTYPDELTGKENMQDRIEPMITRSPRLRAYMTGVADDSADLRINLQHMPIYIAWARSAARLGNKPIRYLILDEVDKYPDAAGKREADPISLGEARTTTYRHNRKIWKFSTPTVKTAPIWKALTTEAQVVFDYFAVCPNCGHEHLMRFDRIKWARKDQAGADGKFHSEDPERIEAEKLAWYECPHCEAQWNDFDRDLAVRLGRWRAREVRTDDEGRTITEAGRPLSEYLRARQPAKIGFHIPSWISPFVSLSSVAAAFLKSKSDLAKFKDFYNKHLAEPWELTVTSKREDQVLAARVLDLSPQTVPDAAILLSLGIDQQEHGYWYVVRAWAANTTSWLIHYGFVATDDEIDAIAFDGAYAFADDGERAGRSLRIFRLLRDTGGGKKYESMTMTEQAYFWILKNRGRGGVQVWGSKGASNPIDGNMLKLGPEIVSTARGKKLPGGLRILSIDTEKAKDQFHYRLSMAANPETRSMPGAAFLHSKVGMDYVAQILAEEKKIDDKGREAWVNPHQRPNHLLDCEILAAACVEMEFPGGGLRLIAERMKQQEQETAARDNAQQSRPQQAGRTGWFNRGG